MKTAKELRDTILRLTKYKDGLVALMKGEQEEQKEPKFVGKSDEFGFFANDNAPSAQSEFYLNQLTAEIDAITITTQTLEWTLGERELIIKRGKLKKNGNDNKADKK
jgi:hypothetical protein